MRILLTGANGVVGTELAMKLRDQGYLVVPVIRCSSTGKYLLSQSDIGGSDLVIHAGLPGHPRTLKKRREYITNTNELFEKVRIANRPLIFISSHSSRANNPSQYSRDKHFLEKKALDNNLSILRIGVFLATVDLRQSLVVRFLKLFGTPELVISSKNLPSTNSVNIVSSIQLILSHDHKVWNCFSSLSSKFSIEEREVEKTIDSFLLAVNFVDFNQNKLMIYVVNLLNKLTFSFTDPIINLMYDLRHYAK